MTRVGGRPIGRRAFLVRTGRGVLGVVVLGVAGCSGDDTAEAEPSQSAGSSGTGSRAPDSGSENPSSGATGLEWSRVDLGFVAAYVLVRGSEAAVVDTGTGGAADRIGDVLDEAGPGWDGVRHVVLTHRHPDHVGSLGDVADRSPGAALHAGEADLAAIDAPRRLRPVGDGDDVFGLQVVATPGHTAGHIAIFDPGSGVLVAGDALTSDDGLAGPNPQFTEDEKAAAESVHRLARLAPRVVLVGHGPPVERDAAAELRRLAESLG